MNEQASPTPQDWKDLMTEWNQTIIKKLVDRLPPESVQRGWLGNAGATEAEITQLENRLGNIKLPPSYRTFLEFTNGWNGRLTKYIYELWSTTQIEWLKDRHPSIIEDADYYPPEWVTLFGPQVRDIPDEEYFVYGPEQKFLSLRLDYLPGMLEASNEGNMAIFLLNPKIVSQSGEWEAWFWASWLPGAQRYPSFWKMMTEQFRDFTNNL